MLVGLLWSRLDVNTSRSHSPPPAALHRLQLRCNQAALPGGQRRRHKGNSRGQTSDGTLPDPGSAARSTGDLHSQSASVFESSEHLVRVNMSSLIIPPPHLPPLSVFSHHLHHLRLSSLVFLSRPPDVVNLPLPQETGFPLKTVCVRLWG